ncbi:MAG: hypothetical protein Q7R88_01985 [bacterium]|nr:hypothetical protein [bacterium]
MTKNNMLTFERQSEIFERITRDQRGKLFRVRFVIIERGGLLRGKILSCEPVFEIPTVKGQRSTVNGSSLCLPCFIGAGTHATSRLAVRKVTSPFSSFDFLTSIKIRAPSLF